MYSKDYVDNLKITALLLSYKGLALHLPFAVFLLPAGLLLYPLDYQ